jgi:hypothetical protein
MTVPDWDDKELSQHERVAIQEDIKAVADRAFQRIRANEAGGMPCPQLPRRPRLLKLLNPLGR